MGVRGRLIVCTAMAVFFWTAEVAVSAANLAPKEPPQSLRDHPVSEFAVPKGEGAITDRLPAEGAIEAATVFIVQDAHVNYQAQKHLASIIDHLAKTYGIEWVFVEGGSGDASLSYLRPYKSMAERQTIAEEFLKAGKISGEEYLDLTVDYPLKLWGVEDPSLYDENLTAFLSSETTRTAMRPFVRSLREVLAPVKQRHYPAALQALEQAAAAYEKDGQTLAAFLAVVSEGAKNHAVSLDHYPAVQRFVELHQREAQLDTKAVQADQRALLLALKPTVSTEQWNEIVQASRDVQQKHRTQADYLALLAGHAKALPGGLTAYPALEAFLAYTGLSGAINAATLAKESDALAHDVEDAMAATATAKAVLGIDRHLGWFDRLFGVELTPDEYVHLKQTGGFDAGIAEQWRQLLSAEGVSSEVLARLDALERGVAELSRFYDVAQRRDAAFVSRMAEKLTETGAKRAVFRVGGFHAQSVARRLHERGLAVVVIAPQVPEATDQQLYYDMLRYKAGLAGEHIGDIAMRSHRE